MGMSKKHQVSDLQQDAERFARESFQLLQGLGARLGGTPSEPRRIPVRLVRRRKAEPRTP